MDVLQLEAAWAELLRLSGDLVVSRSRGEPLEPWTATGMLTRRYRSARRAFVDAMASVRPDLSPSDQAAMASIRACLPYLDELEPTPGLPVMDDAEPDGSSVAAHGHDQALRRALYRRYGRVTSAIPFGGEILDRLTVFTRLAREPDPMVRRQLFAALQPVWRAVDGDGERRSPYRQLLAASARRWRESGSPIEAGAAELGFDPGSVERLLRDVLGGWRRLMPADPVEPWDYHYLCGAAARRLDPLIPLARMREINDAYVTSLGADVARLGIGYDIVDRPGRPVHPVPFAMARGPVATPRGPWRARPPWVFATYREGGLGQLNELLHETGHAIHFAAVACRPAYFDFPMAMGPFVEGAADLLGFDVDEPAWQAHWLGDAVSPREAAFHRYGAVMLDVSWALFELVLHREPDRRPNDVWTEITTEGLGIAAHPEWSWWAVRGQLIDLPGYMSNYAFSAILAAAVRSRLRDRLGDWSTGNDRWYPTLTAAFYRTGSEVPPAELLRRFLGQALTAEPLLADLDTL